MPRDTKPRILARALKIVGDREQLARRLQVSSIHLAKWIDGEAQPPDDIFLKAVDIVLAAGLLIPTTDRDGTDAAATWH
jgi:hypothetical protein